LVGTFAAMSADKEEGWDVMANLRNKKTLKTNKKRNMRNISIKTLVKTKPTLGNH